MNPKHSPGPPMKSPVKRTMRINGRKTSVSLEDGFRNALNEIAATQKNSCLTTRFDN
jgi:predicted DNA-binding ribbon-helix-helix protein